MKKYGDHITNKYDKFFEYHTYDEVLKERCWTGDIQKLKNYCLITMMMVLGIVLKFLMLTSQLWLN